MKLKKNLTRLISLVVLLAMCLSGTSVFALYDVDHSTAIGGISSATYPNNTDDIRDKAIYAAGKFTIGGKDFILLDKDSEGNYFVATADTYGRYKYHLDDMKYSSDTDNGLRQKTPLVTATKSGETWTIDDSAAKTFIEDQRQKDWTYSTTNEKSIGYWLNNGFLTSGNGTGNILPDKIQNHLVSKTWAVEPVKPLRKTGTDNGETAAIEATNGVMNLDRLLKLQMASYTTGPAKVSLLSYSEYVKYWEKLGVIKNDEDTKDVWKNGILLRTPSLRIEWDANTKGYAMVRGAAGVLGQNSFEYNQLGILAFRDAAGTKYYVRPVFWLDKDFFVKEEANISGAGAEITAEISAAKTALSAEFASNPYAVRRRYTDDELSTLGLLTVTDEGYQAVGYPTSSSLASFGDNYYNARTDRRKAWTLDSPTSKQTPNDAYAFEFGGQKFLVLDNDGKGNYFVSAYDSYGWCPVPYTTKTELSTDATANDLSFVFDYTNEGSIAYYLDNTFKNTRLPEQIAENIKTHTWEIEGIASCGDSNTGSKIDAMSTVIETYRNVDLGTKATTTGGVALISLTEYMKYRNILGHIDTSNATGNSEKNNLWKWDVLMRTPMAMVKDDSTVIPGVFVYNRNAFDYSTDKKTKISRSNQAAHKDNQLRPVFWLKGDFFKKNKIDLSKAGSEVTKILANMTQAEALAAGYTLNEYNALKGIIPAGVLVSTNVEGTDLSAVTSITATLKNTVSVSNDINVLAIIAIYDDLDKLIDVKLEEITLPKNSAEATLTLTKDISVTYDNKTYGRVFVWSSSDDIVPYEEATPFGAK